MAKSLFKLAVEELEEKVEVTEAPISEELTAEVEEQTADLDSVSSDVEKVEDVVDTVDEIDAVADAASATLEETPAPLEEGATPPKEGEEVKMVEGEGLTEKEAEFVELAAESFARKLKVIGIKRTTSIAKESFTAGNRRNATKQAVEGLKDMAKSAWARVVAFFEKLKGWIKDFFKKVFDSATKLKAAAVATAAKIEAFEGTSSKEGVKGKFLNRLYMEGGVDSAKVMKGIFKFSEFANDALDVVAKTGEGCSKILDNSIKQEEADKLVLNFGMDRLCHAKTVANGIYTFKSDELIGNRCMVTTVVTNEGNFTLQKLTANLFGGLKTKFTTFNDNAPDIESGKALDKNAGIRVAKSVENLCDVLEACKVKAGTIMTIINSVKMARDNRALFETQENVKIRARAATALGMLMNTIPPAVLSEGVRVGHAALQYALTSTQERTAEA